MYSLYSIPDETPIVKRSHGKICTTAGKNGPAQVGWKEGLSGWETSMVPPG